MGKLRECTLNFGEGLVWAVMYGDKRITLRRRRPEAHDFNQGDVVIGKFEEGHQLYLFITDDTEVTTFAELTDEVAREDGFNDADDALEKMIRYYPDLQPSDSLAIIRFQILR